MTFLIKYLKLLLEQGLETYKENNEFCFWLNAHNGFIWRPNVGHDIWYKLKSLIPGLETWHKNYL